MTDFARVRTGGEGWLDDDDDRPSRGSLRDAEHVLRAGLRVAPGVRGGRVRLRRNGDLDRIGNRVPMWYRPRGFGPRNHAFRESAVRDTPPMGKRVSGVAGEAGRIPAF